MKLLLVGLLASTGAAFAASNAPISYHDGTLVSFVTPSSGSNCGADAHEACSDEDQAQYVVRSEGILYALTPVSTSTGSIAERATLGWSRAVSRNSSLYHQPAGTAVQLRDDGRHLFVKVGSRESRYIAIESR